jgi:hypothetical protein
LSAYGLIVFTSVDRISMSRAGLVGVGGRLLQERVRVRGERERLFLQPVGVALGQGRAGSLVARIDERLLSAVLGLERVDDFLGHTDLTGCAVGVVDGRVYLLLDRRG